MQPETRQLNPLYLVPIVLFAIQQAVYRSGQMPWMRHTVHILGLGWLCWMMFKKLQPARIASFVFVGALMLGGVLNLVAIVSNNGSMYVDPIAAERVAPGRTDGDIIRSHTQSAKSEISAFLGDRFPSPVRKVVFSIGDVLIAIGLVGTLSMYNWIRYRSKLQTT